MTCYEDPSLAGSTCSLRTRSFAFLCYENLTDNVNNLLPCSNNRRVLHAIVAQNPAIKRLNEGFAKRMSANPNAGFVIFRT